MFLSHETLDFAFYIGSTPFYILIRIRILPYAVYLNIFTARFSHQIEILNRVFPCRVKIV